MKHQRYGSVVVVLLLCSALLISFSLLSGCKGSTGSAGSTTGSISGVVTTATTTVPLAGVTVSTNPNAGTATTDASGNYSMSLPAGTYTVTFALAGYTTSAPATVNVAVGLTSPLNASLATATSGQPSVTLSANGQNVGYNTPVALTATATSPKGGATLTYTWSGGAAAGTPTSSATATTP